MVHFGYMLLGGSGRHYIDMTSDLARRIEQHQNGHTHTTKRLGGELLLIASKACDAREEAAAIEKKLKGWKNPAKGSSVSEF